MCERCDSQFLNKSLGEMWFQGSDGYPALGGLIQIVAGPASAEQSPDRRESIFIRHGVTSGGCFQTDVGGLGLLAPFSSQGQGNGCRDRFFRPAQVGDKCPRQVRRVDETES